MARPHMWMLAAAMTVAVAGAVARAAEEAPNDPVVATVDGHDIRRSDVFAGMERVPAQLRQRPPEQLFAAVLEQIINSRLIINAARSEGLADDADVRARIASATDQVLQDAFLTREVRREVTDEAVRAHYDELVKDAPAEEEVRASHILVQTETEAREVLKALEGGGAFDEVARARSKGPSSSAGGDLGFFRREQMVPPFAEAAFGLATGAVSGPVQTQFGWHIIKVVERRTVRGPDFAEIEQQLRAKMTSDVINAILEDLRGKAEIGRPDDATQPRIRPAP